MLTASVDLGGTNIKLGLVRDGQALATTSIPSNAREGLRPQLGRIERAIRGLLDQAHLTVQDCVGLGIAFPGLIDPHAGRVVSTPKEKYDDICEIDLHAWSRDTLGLPLRIENDAHVALLGEWQFGAGRGVDNLIVMTLGTGIGTSVLINGRPLRGAHHQAGVLGGHLIVVPNGRPCPCGARGCVETECSSVALPQIAREHSAFESSALAREPAIDYSAVFRLAGAGDTLSIELRDRAMSWWGALVVTLVHAFDPQRVVIGGGIMRSGDVILPRVREFVRENAWTPWGQVEVIPAKLGDDASLLGLSVLFGRGLEFL